MAYPPNHTFSPPVPRDPADEYVHDKLFSINRRDNALNVNPSANNYVHTVADDSDENLDFIRDQILAGMFSYVPGVYHQYVRDALRPASRGEGRGRYR